MESELNLVADLALILISAGVFTIISKALKQPPILGYIIAGILVGPHLGLFPKLGSPEAVNQWSEIGIIFLMFALGLEFSFKKILKVGTSALLIAGVKFIGLFVVGMVAGTGLGWTFMESVFLGGLLSMSSTAIVVKAYDEMGLKDKPYASTVFGTLVFEDIIAILLMVLLSTMAVSNKFAGGEMIANLAKLAFFLILWFLAGIFIIPTFLRKSRRFINDEILLIVSIGLCFGMVSIASAAGFSSALGAFVMGSILAETVEGEHIHKLVLGIKDLFSAIFFVSVGMMVDPVVIGQHWGTILLLVVLVIVGHIVFAGAGSLLAGKGIDNSVHVGFSLAQLGEFGFILASVGLSLGVVRPFIYPVIIAVSVITTFTTPYVLKFSDRASALAFEKLPKRWIDRLEPDDDNMNSGSTAAHNTWKELMKAYLLRVLLYSVLLLAILIGSHLYLHPLLGRALETWSQTWKDALTLAITLAVMSPFLYGLAVTGGSIKEPASRLLKENKSNVWPILSLMFLRMFAALGFVLAAIVGYFSLSAWTMVLIVVAGVSYFYAMKTSVHKFKGVEKIFLDNLNARENEARRQAPVASYLADRMSGYDIHIEIVEIDPDSDFVGMKLKDVPFRKEAGVNIVKILRGTRRIIIPGGEEFLYPYDKVSAVGTTEQIRLFRDMMASAGGGSDDEGSDVEFTVRPVTLTENSVLAGKSLKDIRMRDYGCMVISVMHNGKFTPNPRPDVPFEKGDIVWVAGESGSLSWLE